MAAALPRSQETWDCMLPGPPSRNNGGCADCNSAGLLAFGAGSSVVVADPRSMQLVSVLPMPSPSSISSFVSSSSASAAASASSSAHSLSPFVTAVRWIPQPPSRDISSHDDPSNSHLLLAAGDRQGRIAIWDFRSRLVVHWLELDPADRLSRLGIQDICWIRSDAWLIASIHGPSLLALWSSTTGRCLWKYDASPEYLSCIRRDPFDSRHFCLLGVRGFLLSAVVLLGGVDEVDVSIQEHQIPVETSELQKLERESMSSGPNPPALAAFPLYLVRFCFSPRWPHILLVTCPKEFLVFDLQYGECLSSMSLPRGIGKFMDVVADPETDRFYCAHLDGKLSIWNRKEGGQIHILCSFEELIPSIGTVVPSPAILAVVIWQSESFIQNFDKICVDSEMQPSQISSSVSSELSTKVDYLPKSFVISISDDGKIWSWLLTSDKARDYSDASCNTLKPTDISEIVSDILVTPTDNSFAGNGKETEPVRNSNIATKNSSSSKQELLPKINLIGQIHLLSSTVTTLAVPSPSLIATVARGGNNPAPAVPLVALGTQNGYIDIIDVSANAVAASFYVHNGPIRGLRWLGNSRLVSFSYSQVTDKVGGYNNRLIVTCLRSGLNRPFRLIQKPERAPLRALRASSSGRYLLLLFRDAPVEVWAMTKNPIMLRSLALPFTVLEWTLPTAPRPSQNGPLEQSSLLLKERPSNSLPDVKFSSTDSKTSQEGSGDDTSESFAFALVNGALGVFEVHGRRIRDFRPKWPSSSFVPSDGLVTAMAYRLPHVVMGDRLGNIRWWDVKSGHSSSFNTHKEGIRRIKFSPVVSGDRSRGRIAVLFNDNTFSIFDLDTSDPLANALLQPRSPGTLVLELDWLPMRTKKDEPLVLCIAGADSSFRLIEVNINDYKSISGFKSRAFKERFRPMPLCLPAVLPASHAFALRMIMQLGVQPSWFSSLKTTEKGPSSFSDSGSTTARDLRKYMVESNLPDVGDPVIPELLLKVLEPYRKEGCIFDDERARVYGSLLNKGIAARLAFVASLFGELSEALFWLKLPCALRHLVDRSSSKSSQETFQSAPVSDSSSVPVLGIINSEELTLGRRTKNKMKDYSMAFEQEVLHEYANERILWHGNLDGEESVQKRVHELVSVGNLEAAVSLLLSTPPEASNFYPNALRAVVLSSAVSRSLHELAVKVVAANMVRTDKTLSGIHLLCAVGKYQEACSQLQDAGCWIDAATLAASHLYGADYARVLHRWADYVLHSEHNIWRALILYVAAGALHDALATLRDAQQPDTAVMFLLACHETYTRIVSAESPAPPTTDEPLESLAPLSSEEESLESRTGLGGKLRFPGRSIAEEDLVTVSEYFGEYQRKLVHLCMDDAPLFD